jgi:hypothetical protein
VVLTAVLFVLVALVISISVRRLYISGASQRTGVLNRVGRLITGPGVQLTVRCSGTHKRLAAAAAERVEARHPGVHIRVEDAVPTRYGVHRGLTVNDEIPGVYVFTNRRVASNLVAVLTRRGRASYALDDTDLSTSFRSRLVAVTRRSTDGRKVARSIARGESAVQMLRSTGLRWSFSAPGRSGLAPWVLGLLAASKGTGSGTDDPVDAGFAAIRRALGPAYVASELDSQPQLREFASGQLDPIELLFTYEDLALEVREEMGELEIHRLPHTVFAREVIAVRRDLAPAELAAAREFQKSFLAARPAVSNPGPNEELSAPDYDTVCRHLREWE